MPSIGVPELVIILALALLVVGPGKLPAVGEAIGKTIREVRGGLDDVKSDQ
jgi:sec-independent protein translocase protein TatA